MGPVATSRAIFSTSPGWRLANFGRNRRLFQRRLQIPTLAKLATLGGAAGGVIERVFRIMGITEIFTPVLFPATELLFSPGNSFLRA